jgi:hypothetical protein
VSKFLKQISLVAEVWKALGSSAPNSTVVVNEDELVEAMVDEILYSKPHPHLRSAFIRTVWKLARFHAHRRNFTEAGCSLMFYYDTLDFSEKILEALDLEDIHFG